MMNGEVEKVTLAKDYNLSKLSNSRMLGSYKKGSSEKSAFERYCDGEGMLHENEKAMKVLSIKLARVQNKQLLLSPKYKSADIKERMLSKALGQVLQGATGPADPLRVLGKQYVETSRRLENAAVSADNQCQLEKLQNALHSHLRVSSLAHK